MITAQPKNIDVFLDIGSDFVWTFPVVGANDFEFYATMSRNYAATITKVFDTSVTTDGDGVSIKLAANDTTSLKPDQYEYELRKKHKTTGWISRVAYGNLIATGNQYAWGAQ